MTHSTTLVHSMTVTRRQDVYSRKVKESLVEEKKMDWPQATYTLVL